MTQKQVADIIESTAQKVGGYNYQITAGRPNGTWNNEMGYGLVNAYAAVQEALCLQNPNFDLMVKDSEEDVGIEPNTQTGIIYESSDIWVRNLQDNGLTHQNPIFVPYYHNYIYVRIRNIGCENSKEDAVVNLYWAKAGTNLWWPYSWEGNSYFSNGASKGKPIGTMSIPVLHPGEEIIIKFPWISPNPNDYLNISGDMDNARWHFCLLARIESESDPIIYTNGSNLEAYTRGNNNVAWKNITVVDTYDGETSGVIVVGDVPEFEPPFRLKFVSFEKWERPLYKEAEITIALSAHLFEIWERGGREHENIEFRDNKTLRVVGENASLNNLYFEEEEYALLDLSFHFLTQEVTDKETYTFHVIQEDATGKLIGGEVYQINRKPRELFKAKAGENVSVDKDEFFILNATDIGEEAIYNWYDETGNLIYEGVDFATSANIAQKYKLEVIASADGYKDYAEVAVAFNPNRIEKIFPNPFLYNQLHVEYKLNAIDNAYLSIANYYYASIFNNYILDVSSNNVQLDLQSYPAGLYVISLICNGEISDTKTFIKQ